MRMLAGLVGCLFVLSLLLVVPAVADDVDKYIQDLKDSNSSVKRTAAAALDKLSDPRAVVPLIQTLKDEDPLVREDAAMALGHLNDTSAVEPLIQALKDNDYRVRCSAAWALGDLKDTRAVEPLIPALKDVDSNIRECTADALGNLKDTRAVDPLIQTLKDEESNVRRAATLSLGTIGDTRGVDPLIQALKDEDNWVREGAAWSLGELGDTRAVDPLIQALKDEDSIVQKAARDALEKLGWREGLATTKGIAPENVSAAQGGDWSGWWETSAGDMQLKQSGSIVTGTYGNWGGSIQGNASGNMLIGKWHYVSPSNTRWEGDLEFNMSDDCKSFSGRSREYGDWGNWTGTRLLKRVVSEKFISDYVFAQYGYPSPDYTKIAYENSTPEGRSVVVAGPEGKTEGKAYKDGYRSDSMRFSPDSRRFAIWAYVGDKRVAVVDGVEGEAYNEIDNWALTFSPDSQHIAYRAKSCDNDTCKWVMVLDGVEQPYYGDVQSEPVFSNPESGTGKTHIGYNIVVDNHGYVVVDGKKLELEGLGPVFSPDGKRLAYARNAAYTTETTYIVLDGVSTGNLGDKPTSVWFIYAMYFSPDSKRFVYDACPNGLYSGAHVILSENGRSSIYSDIGPVIFSPDSTHLAYKGKNETTGLWEVVLDDKEGKGYNWGVSDPIFSPDSKHMAYIANNDNGKFVVLDGNEGKNYSEVWALTFSPDSKRIAYVARDDKDDRKQFVVVDGQEGKRYSVEIKWGPFFSPDSKHVVYVTSNCYECSFKELVVVDEVEEKIPYNVVAGIVFDSNSTIHYLAATTYQTYLFEERLEGL